MSTFYFTYGTEGQPFVGGWTEVEAENRSQAIQIFRIHHPDKIEGIINCSSIYNEEEFSKTCMVNKGNFGHRAWEQIGIVVKNCDTGVCNNNKIVCKELNIARDSKEKTIRDRLVDSFITEMQERGEYDLESDEEWEALYDKLLEYFDSPVDFFEHIIHDGYNASYIKEMVDEIIEDRTEIFRIPIHIEQTFDVYVRAKNEGEALRRLRCMATDEFEDYYDTRNMGIEIDPYSELAEVEEWEASDIIDAY